MPALIKTIKQRKEQKQAAQIKKVSKKINGDSSDKYKYNNYITNQS